MLDIYYQKKHKTVTALPIDLTKGELTYQKWGGEQKAKQGDWLVCRDGEYYTVEKESFTKTYRKVEGSTYIKTAPVWVERAQYAGEIKTKEGITQYSKGDYLVYNNEDKFDGYAVEKTNFESMYQRELPSTVISEMNVSGDNKMNAQDYIDERVEGQISWYENKSSWNQRRFKFYQLSIIIFGALIPLITVVDFHEYDVYARFLIALLGSLIAIFSAIINLYKFQENWVKYRATAETLIREKYLYLTRSQPYSDDENANLKVLVERCQAVMSAENSAWIQATTPNENMEKAQ
ncbi:MAG: DUF4231 domain-containing protein [Cellvibrionaceae bacterium]